MTSTGGQSDIYHARMVQVISMTPGQNSTPVQGQTRTVYSQPQEGYSTNLFSNDIHHRHQLDTSSQKAKMGSDGERTPPLPPRATKNGGKPSSAQERLNLNNGNRNFLTKYFEQNSYAQGNKTINGGVKQLRGILKKSDAPVLRENDVGRETPPPKLPPRIRKRPVSYPTKEEALSPPNGIIHDKSNGERQFPQPLTKTNVTKHDQIWTKEDKDKPINSVLSPPLNHITPESTEEMWEKFDRLDVLDSASDHSDSSADTMIMMTTEEEEKNQSRITQSMQKFKTQKDPVFDRNMQIQFESTGNNDSVEESKKSTKSISQLSPKSEDTDDGYGTNSSQGTTVSSPLSSSLTSLNVITDTDISNVHGAPKLAIATSTSTQQENSAILNPSKTTWAVRRRTKMAESKENASSLQEQLRQLAIIEEEENTQTNDVSGNSIDRVSRSKNPSVKLRNSPEEPSVDESMDSVTSDLEKFEGDLYDKMIDMDRNYRNYCGFDKDFDVKTADSKVLYFQDKVLKQNYGSDNYYNPRGYYGKEYGEAGSERLDSSMGSVGSLPRNMSLPRDYTSQENSSYRSSTSYSSGVGSVDGRFHQLTNMSMDNIRVPKNLTLPGMPGKGHFSSSDNLTQNGRRPLFASSADIQKLFQTRDNISDQLQRPASCRHSFHAMPCTQQWIVDAQNEADINVPRPRAASASVSSKSKSSWNPFGGMFSKKKNKSGGSSQDVTSKNKTRAETSPAQKPIIKSGTNVSSLPNGPLRRYAEKKGIEALPNSNAYDLPFRTVKQTAPSGSKLSTLV